MKKSIVLMAVLTLCCLNEAAGDVSQAGARQHLGAVGFPKDYELDVYRKKAR